MSSKNFHKTEIIYRRIKEEYFETPLTWAELGDKLDITRQALRDRRKKEDVNYNELRRIFPDINKDWLYSDSIDELKILPVKKKLSNEKKGDENRGGLSGNQEYGLEQLKAAEQAIDRVGEPRVDYLLQLVRLKDKVDEKIQKLIDQKDRSGDS